MVRLVGYRKDQSALGSILEPLDVEKGSYPMLSENVLAAQW
jgi:hypothetical protein